MSDRIDTATLADLCDVFVPAVRPPRGAPRDARPFFALTASEAGTADAVARLLPTLLDATELDDLGTLLAGLRRLRLGALPPSAARGLLAAISAADDDAAAGVRDLRQLTQVVHYGGVGTDGRNPTWPHVGYPGPSAPAAPPGGRLPVTRPGPDEVASGSWRLGADAVVVGSGAGGGVVAARLAASGLDVLVLEAGSDMQEEDFPTDELSALHSMYWRHGLVTTEDDNVAVLAGATLGGGTTINWSNWVAPPSHVRAEWATEHGLDGLDGGDFDDDLAAVGARVGATAEGTRPNGANASLLAGAEALGWSAELTTRNVDLAIEDDRATGLTGFGDRSGAKQGSLRTWLRDAVDADARVITDCTVEVVRSVDGRATGVSGWWTGPAGQRVTVEVDAPVVVLAAGALGTPGVLLRSGIGGPAVGRHLRLHPVPAIHGVHDEPQEGWKLPPQGVVVDEFAATWGGHGYLLETAHYHPGLSAALVAWRDPRDVKLVMSRFGHIAPFLAVVRERGSGRVTLGADGHAVAHHPLDDDLDRQVVRRAVRHLVEVHVAAGARTVLDVTAPGRRTWRQGQPWRGFADACAAAPLGADGRRLFSAHQMGSARMGVDERTSVADTDGQLRDVRGVWIGDASAFPTAVGANPMCTVMALAHRTASRILAHR